jgi:hypothetical protein
LKQITNATVIQQADRYHELQRQRRELRVQIAELEDEMRKIQPVLRKAGEGQDFAFASSDEFMKVCEISQAEEREDVPKMREMLLKLRRKIPMISQTLIVLRWMTDDELEDENFEELPGGE